MGNASENFLNVISKAIFRICMKIIIINTDYVYSIFKTLKKKN